MAEATGVLVSDWIQAVAQHNPNLLTSTIDASIESHIMCFMAEKSRMNNTVMDIKNVKAFIPQLQPLQINDGFISLTFPIFLF